MRSPERIRAERVANSLETEYYDYVRALSGEHDNDVRVSLMDDLLQIRRELTDARIVAGQEKSLDSMVDAYQHTHGISESRDETLERPDFQRDMDIIATSKDLRPHGEKAQALVRMGLRDPDDEREVNSY